MYKAHCAIKKTREHLDDVALFVRSLKNADDEADDNYYDSEYEDSNDNYIEKEYADNKEDIFDDLEYDDSDSE